MIGSWRGEGGRSADMTLVWGVAAARRRASSPPRELAGLAVDQCAIAEDRFTLIAPDAYRGDFLDVKLWDADGRELASESLYVEDDEDDDEDDASRTAPAAPAAPSAWSAPGRRRRGSTETSIAAKPPRSPGTGTRDVDRARRRHA